MPQEVRTWQVSKALLPRVLNGLKWLPPETLLGEPTLIQRVAFRYWEKKAGFFSVGDIVLFGKYKNKGAKIIRIFEDEKGHPSLELEPIPKGRKKNKVIGLYKIWKAPPERAQELLDKAKAAEKTAQQLVLRVAARHQLIFAEPSRTAAMTEDKLKDLLLKIRKGSTTTLSWGQISEVLTYLDPGWKLEKIVGLVKLYGSKEHPDHHETVTSDKQAEVEERHNRYSPFAVNSLPASPKHNTLYALDLAPIKEIQWIGKPGWQFTFFPWMGHEGWKLTTPAGEVFNGLPERYGIDGSAWWGWKTKTRTKLPTWDAVKWLNQNTDWLEQINKKLGLGVFEKAVPRTRESTGSCPVCFQNIKIRNNDIVLHGYKRPGTGQIHGNCFGMGYPAFELAVKGTKEYLHKMVEPQYERTKKVLAFLKSDEVDKLDISSGGAWSPPKWIDKNHKDWDYHLKEAISQAERSLANAEEVLKDYTNLVHHWKERPLPKEGERHIDWYYAGQKS